jgi:hypothetical protein
MPKYQGSCHCGAVSFAFTAPVIEKAMRCDCSICVRKGIMMSADVIPPDQIEIQDDTNALRVYQFATRQARHHFCGVCGVHVFVETRLNPDWYRVNLGCVEGLNAIALPTEMFPGKDI